MRRIVLGAVLLTLLSPLAALAGPTNHTQPFGADLVWQEQNHGANRPWLDPTCYDDDHTAVGFTTGWLDAGQTYVIESKRLVCNEKIQRGLLSFHKRLDGDLTLIDYGLHEIGPDRRVFEWKSNVSDGVCNTDRGLVIPGVNIPPGQLHVDLDPTGSEPGEPASVATWIVHANKAGVYTLQMILNEPWWQGGESSPEYCGL